ncbi:hypothetical protein R6Q57_018078, partial [Mikania cordata]
MNIHFTSSPLNNDLLWLSGSHGGDYYFQNPNRDDEILRIRRGDQDFWKHLISNLIPKNFNWIPYENMFHLLPGICLSGQASWRCETHLIFWEIVEPLPSRVMRQFRMFQPIPVNTHFGEQEHIRLHKIGRTGGQNVNWLQKHNQHVLSWIRQHNHIVTEELTDS